MLCMLLRTLYWSFLPYVQFCRNENYWSFGRDYSFNVKQIQTIDKLMKEQIVYEDNHLLVLTKKSDSLYRVIKPVMNHYWNYQNL
jgi:hypothetical protein